MPDSRGVVYIRWGSRADTAMQRSVQSLRVHHPELPVHAVQIPASATLLDKTQMFDLSPFDQTLFLDADTVVMDRLDFGFEKAVRFGIACCICECPWARRYGGLSGDLIEYNTGVMFFSRQVKPLFDLWKKNAPTLDSSILFKRGTETLRMPLNDQGSFALSMEESGVNPFILPLNWNFRPQWQHVISGPIKIWHDYRDVPPEMERWTRNQAGGQKVIDFAKIQ